jgi:hypothetical protein
LLDARQLSEQRPARPVHCRRLPFLKIVTFLALVALTACGGGGGSDMKSTMTLDEAARRAHELFDQAAAQLPGAVVVSRGAETPSTCDDPTDHGPVGRKFISVEKRIDGLDVAQYNHYFDVLRDYWLSHGYRLLDDSRPRDMYMWVENVSDGFQTSVTTNDRGEFYMGTSSPCVWPNGTPNPGK